ncbi:MAG: hypothetical protein NTY35_12140 [Planctomycetota bacterium]|nr:hypothetical protein [Planctomycetota bacterium]
MKLSHRVLSVAALALSASLAPAQNFNINVGSSNPTSKPANTFGAGANQPGEWNAVSANLPSTPNLVDVTGAPTTVSIALVGGFGNFQIANPAWNGDDEKLLELAADVGSIGQGGGTITWTFSGLAAGTYEITTYAIAPDQPAVYRTRVAIAGAAEPAQIVGGAWPGQPYVLGVTHARHTVAVGVGQNLVVVTNDPGTPAGNLSTVNGFQIKGTTAVPVGTPFCFGDGTGTACPCGNASAFGANEGCLNSLGLGGKLLATGVASLANDTLRLNGTRMPDSSALFFQGTAQQASGTGAVFGDGLRCAAGTITRLGTKTNAAGASSYPTVGDQSVSQRGVVLGAGTREYQVWYRNAAAFCTASTFNLTNGLQVTWAP